MKADYSDKIAKLEARLSGIGEEASDIKALLSEGVSNVFRLQYIYVAGDVERKREVIGSIYPEKFSFCDFSVRTTYVNEVVELIYTRGAGFDENKNGTKQKKSVLSRMVALSGQFTNHFLQDLKRLARLSQAS